MGEGGEAGGDPAPPERVVVDHLDLLGDVRTLSLGRYRGVPVEVRCHALQATAYREVADLALAIAGSGRRVWTDARGEREPGVPAPRAVLRLLRELVLDAPRSWLRHRKAVRSLIREYGEGPGAPEPPGGGDAGLGRCLYLRTDHDLGLEAGGSVSHVSGVVTGLRKEGTRVTVVSTDRVPGVPDDERFLELTPRYEPVRNVRSLALLGHGEDVLEAAAERWERWRPDFLYHRYSFLDYSAPALRRRHGVPLVTEYNGSMVWVARHWDRRRLLLPGLTRAVEELNLRAADLVVVVSEALADDVHGRGVPRERILVNPNGVDPDRYRPDAPGAGEIRARHGLEGKVVVGFIGTFGPWHGAEELVRAAAVLSGDSRVGASRVGDGPAGELHFLLIGDGVRMPAVRALVREHGLEGRVTLTGVVPQAGGAAHLAACDILVSPHVPNPDGSEFFGSPTKLFEYMATGRGIVASDLAQIGEVLEHGKTGWLVPPGDVDALARGIEVLAADPGLRVRLGEAARAEAVARHTWRAHSRRILDALRRVLDASPAADPSPEERVGNGGAP